MTVTEYRDHFLQLARYAPAEVADDRDKQEHFMEGLEDYIQYALLNLRFDDFNHLVDSAQHGAQAPGDGGQEEEDCSHCFR